MRKQYRLVVFDWEGTLSEDTLGQVLTILANKVQQLNLTILDKTVARNYLHLGLLGVIEKLYPNLTNYEKSSLLNSVQESLADKELILTPGAKQIVEDINQAKIHLAIATNKGFASLQRVLQESGLNAYFKVVRTADRAPAKPCPQMLEELMAEFDVSASETLMIGDSISDMEMASSIGVDAIGMDFYQVQPQELRSAGATHVFDNFLQLKHYLHLQGSAHE